MDFHYNSGFANASSLDRTNNKVYINPNFNKNLLSNGSSHAMHINPNFPQNKNKIFVNPNFIKSKTDNEIKQHFNMSSLEHTFNNVKTETHVSSSITYNQVPAPISKSRYCLVRHNVPKQVAPAPEKVTHTFKISKYKSVPINDVKKKLDKVSTSNSLTFPTQARTTSTMSSTHVNIPKIIQRNPSERNPFKLINNNVKPKTTIVVHKKINVLNVSSSSHRKKLRGHLKKNNIPCPSFRKFGKCLRNTRGGCEFLHDKKHISLCRKFIKGLCHDKDCLLSHDLTSKKMPTCYFYLQGTCTNEDCPYLHVKLNEKTKICSDFIKGYCENGSKCLQRHVNVSSKKKGKNPPHKSLRKTKYKSNKREKITNGLLNEFGPSTSSSQIYETDLEKKTTQHTEKYELASDFRYYQDNQEKETSDETYETIKPMRCKLGTLPSFIQL